MHEALGRCGRNTAHFSRPVGYSHQHNPAGNQKRKPAPSTYDHASKRLHPETVTSRGYTSKQDLRFSPHPKPDLPLWFQRPHNTINNEVRQRSDSGKLTGNPGAIGPEVVNDPFGAQSRPPVHRYCYSLLFFLTQTTRCQKAVFLCIFLASLTLQTD